jgi:hypothetical protein
MHTPDVVSSRGKAQIHSQTLDAISRYRGLFRTSYASKKAKPIRLLHTIVGVYRGIVPARVENVK